MKADVLHKAKELGFPLGRVTTATPPPHEEAFRDWLDEGRHGTMEYLARNAFKRIDPQKVLPGAKSIITLGTSYDQPESWTAGQSAGANQGVIARYARYRDYHDVMKEPLRELCRTIDELGPEGTRSLWYVDTGPLLEKDLAERAGVGFIGKHTNLISRQLGNWFFLAEIITTVELEPDESEVNRCGKCTRCIEACPTQAITAPFKLDARLCISYLTIELKGSIPESMRSSIGSRIYGCDDCLEACPWNRFAQQATLMNSHRREDFDQAELTELLGLDEAGFRTRFKGTPMQRTKRRGILRNVCVALGNVGDPTALPALARALADPEPLIVEHAQWAIDQIKARQSSHPPT